MERRTKSYLRLIKPGIVLSNVMATAAGLLLATSHDKFHLSITIGVLGGIAFVIASACVANNMLDRNIDVRMNRTKGRDLVTGKISIASATLYTFVLGVIGFWLLMAFTNWMTVWLGVLAYVWYVVIYGLAKRTTPLSTIVGAFCGALPPVAGYVALTGRIDPTAWVLFWILLIWQLPHFYAIAIFREDDYRRAGIPLWPVVLGAASTKAQIMFWAVVFALVVPLLTVVESTGWMYFVAVETISLYWVWQGAVTYKRYSDERWAKRMFGISLVVLLVVSASIAIGGYLP